MVEYPDNLDKWPTPLSRAQFNRALTTGRIDLGHLVYAILELQKFIGVRASADAQSLEARLRVIEEQLGIVSPDVVAPTYRTTSISMEGMATAEQSFESIIWHEDQEQAGYVWLITTVGFDVWFAHPHSAIDDDEGDYEAGATGYKWDGVESIWTNVEIGIVRYPDHIHLVPADDFVNVEWWTRGKIGTSTYPRTEIVEISDVPTTGYLYTWPVVWPRTRDMAGDYSLKITAWDSAGGEVEVLKDKLYNTVWLKPAVIASRIRLEAIEYTQSGEGEMDEYIDLRDSTGALVYDSYGVLVRVRRRPS